MKSYLLLFLILFSTTLVANEYRYTYDDYAKEKSEVLETINYKNKYVDAYKRYEYVLVNKMEEIDDVSTLFSTNFIYTPLYIL